MASAATATSVPPPRQQHAFYTSKLASPATPPDPRLQTELIPTADALFEALAHQNPAAEPSSSQGSLANPLTVQVEQLPTPRTSFSSGASSPPENLSPSNSHQHLHQSSHLHSSASSSSASTPTSTLPSTLASSPSHLHGPTTFSSPATKSPLSVSHLYQPQSYPALRSTSPALGPSLYGISSTASPSVNPSLVPSASVTAATFNTQYNGTGVYNLGGGGGVSNTLGGRLPAQAQQYHGQQLYQQQQQQQQESLNYDDEKELQKKNARSALNGVAAFLPPVLNQGLSKVVLSAQELVQSTSNGKFSLPSSRPTDGFYTQSSSAFTGAGGAPALQVDPSSLRGMLLKMYKASKLPLLCLLWYLSSAVTNNIGKQIMNQFRYPVTLTFIQFVFVSLFCFLLGVGGPGFSMTTIRKPTMGILQMTAPLVGFQVVGHVFSSVAISRVPLSVVHTIKALSPLFTVVFYRIILGTTYSRAVYISLVPLTAGVMLACRLSLEFNNLVGLVCALASTLVFVTQNVFTKRILFSTKAKKQQLGGLGNKEATREDDHAEETGSSNAQKLDKINILFYSSTMAAICMVPIWLYAEGLGLMFPDESGVYHHATGHSTGFWAASWLLFLNGVSHFFQNIFAFSVLALTSPVTYSIASLIKRIIVIVASIVYFHQTLGTTQWMGVCMTFWGLWLYNSAKNAAKVNPAGGILANTKVGRRVSRNFGRGLLDSTVIDRKGGFLA
ncbi:suppressor of loss of ypt1 [Mortierella alpina]|uniref:Suppressor of loss of ypt1 n=1 Tax=Mortierella alpina TaxID=64518 RepID=A0A9P6J7C7_MORAP|nr:suppressor of loss of ypt1 [Mortierella alpina]